MQRYEISTTVIEIQLFLMGEPSIQHLHNIYAQINYTYIHIYNFKSIKIIKTNKNTFN